jgi:hypothetical protein
MGWEWIALKDCFVQTELVLCNGMEQDVCETVSLSLWGSFLGSKVLKYKKKVDDDVERIVWSVADGEMDSLRNTTNKHDRQRERPHNWSKDSSIV